MIKANLNRLVEISVIGKVASPKARPSPYRVSPDGDPKVLPGVGGITYNVRVGDPVCGWQADHVEPGVTIKNADEAENLGLNLLACIGNEGVVKSGDAKGGVGVVTGKHGGINHVLLDFPEKTVSKLIVGDTIQVRGHGVGLELTDFPDVKVMNCSPRLLAKMPLRAGRPKGCLRVPVAGLIPAKVMGSGLGQDNAHLGDYDVQLFDPDTVKEFGLDAMRFGDVVALVDADHTYGRVWRRGAKSVGVVVHSACTTAGHGPGVVTLFTSRQGKIQTPKDPDANIGRYLGIGRFRGKRR